MANRAKTLADFRAAHDPDVIIPNRIRAGLAAIEKEGAENWLSEGDFLKLTALSTTQLAQHRDKFGAHIIEQSSGRSGKAGKRFYFGSAKVAAKLRLK
jgi:hypothetical protein